MTSASGAGRVRVDVTLPQALTDELRNYARTWKIPLSTVVELAGAAYLKERASRTDQAPIRHRFRQRPGPLTRAERQVSDTATATLRMRGGRPL